MRRLPRKPDQIGALELFTAVGRNEGYRLGEPKDVDAFVELLRSSLKASQLNDNMLHGRRVEALFAHVVGALGECRFIKSEDAGEIFCSGDRIQPPDYRVVLNNGKQLFVEVKNCHSAHLLTPFTLKRDYFERLERYADIQATPLKIAIFFSRVNRWCLLSKRAFNEKGDSLSVTFPSALAKNEMMDLGDAMLGTLPELRFEVLGSRIDASEVDDQGNAIITFRESRFFCGQREITEGFDKRLVFHLMRFGDWQNDGAEPILDGKRLMGLRFTSRPESVPEGQEYAIAGTLSSMISGAYAEHTVVDRRLIALDARVDPEVFALKIPTDFKSDALPLWRFGLLPNWDFSDPIGDVPMGQLGPRGKKSVQRQTTIKALFTDSE